SASPCFDHARGALARQVPLVPPIVLTGDDCSHCRKFELNFDRTRNQLTLKRQWPDAIQQASTATLPSSTDLMRPSKTRDLHQRLTSTSVQLVHRGDQGSGIRPFPGVRQETVCRYHQAGAVKRTANAAARSAASCIAVRSVLAGLGADNAPSRSAAWSATSCIEVRLVLAGLGAENAASRSAASSRAAQV